MRKHLIASCCLLAAACGGPAPAPDPTAPSLTALDPPAGAGAMAPNLAMGSRGPLLSWLEPVASGDRSRWRWRISQLSGESWQPAVTLAEGDDFFANWADFPAIVEAADGSLLAHR